MSLVDQKALLEGNFEDVRAGLQKRGIMLDSSVKGVLARDELAGRIYDAAPAPGAAVTPTFDPRIAGPGTPGIPGNALWSALYLNYISVETIEHLFAPTTVQAALGGLRVEGDPADMLYTFMEKEKRGFVSSYGDSNHNGKVEVDYKQNTLQPYDWQTHLTAGWMAMLQAARTKQDYFGDLRAAISDLNRRTANQVELLGVSGYKCFGALNSPDLEPMIVAAPTGTNSSSAWADKKPQDMVNDIIAASQLIQEQSLGVVKLDRRTKWVLWISNTALAASGRTNEFGLEFNKCLDAYFGSGNLRIEPSPELALSGPQGNFGMFVLFPERVNGMKPWEPIAKSRYVEFPIEIRNSEITGKVFATSTGIRVNYAFAIARVGGIG